MAEPGRTSRARRGVAALAGAVAVAASLTQVVGTMAAPVAVRTATLPISTANYFPTPLATNISCETTGTLGFNRATVRWTAPTPPPGKPAYRYRVVWLLDGITEKYRFDTSNTTTGEFRIREHAGIGDSTAETYRIMVHTINPENPNAVSSGSVSWNVYTPTTPSTRCVGEAGFRNDNQAWENQESWTPPATGFTAAPAPLRMFVSLAQTVDEDVLAEPLPTDAPVGDLAGVTPTPSPTTEGSPGATTPPATSTSFSPVIPPPTSGGEGPASGETATTSAPGSTPAPEGDPTDATSTVPSAPTAGIGDGPISVGRAEARLDEVDGQPQVIVSSGGVQVCAATVPGATAIEESEGSIRVTGGDQTRVVDPATCQIS